MTATLTPAALATELGTDARTTRKFLRATTPVEDHPGKGSRWELKGDKRSIAAYGKRFAKWTAELEAKAAAKNDAAGDDAEVEADETD